MGYVAEHSSRGYRGDGLLHGADADLRRAVLLFRHRTRPAASASSLEPSSISSMPLLVPCFRSRPRPLQNAKRDRVCAEVLPHGHTRPYGCNEAGDQRERDHDDENGTRALRGIGRLYDAQHEPEGRRNECNEHNRSREGYPLLNEVRSARRTTFLFRGNVHFGFPPNRPRSVFARIPAPSNLISVVSPPAEKYVFQNALIASLFSAVSEAKPLDSRRPGQSGTPCRASPCGARRRTASARAPESQATGPRRTDTCRRPRENGSPRGASGCSRWAVRRFPAGHSNENIQNGDTAYK